MRADGVVRLGSSRAKSGRRWQEKTTRFSIHPYEPNDEKNCETPQQQQKRYSGQSCNESKFWERNSDDNTALVRTLSISTVLNVKSSSNLMARRTSVSYRMNTTRNAQNI